MNRVELLRMWPIPLQMDRYDGGFHRDGTISEMMETMLVLKGISFLGHWAEKGPITTQKKGQ